MYKNKKILGLIPARGGSKGLPGKNIRDLLGKPLIGWTIEQGLSSRYLDRVVVSTDSGKIAKIAEKYGAEVPFLRPQKLASDNAKSIDVIIHALDHLRGMGNEFDYIVLLEPTSPLREVSDIDKSIEKLINNKVEANSLVSVAKVVASHPAFDVMINKKGLLVPYNKSFSKPKRRQDLSDLYFFEGTMYISEVEALLKRRSFYHDKTLSYIVPKWKAFEVDDIVDWMCVSIILSNIKKVKRNPDE